MAASLLRLLFPGASADEVLAHTKGSHDQRTGKGQSSHPSPEVQEQIDFVRKFCEAEVEEGVGSDVFGEAAGTVLGGRRR